ncbi:MAG TPA: diguanylate cyclase [Kineosporiaceae bacterium]|nr:diguanylate cyclase [Kineosporiaceae bacterium]
MGDSSLLGRDRAPAGANSAPAGRPGTGTAAGSPYHACVQAAWRTAAERGLPALALVPLTAAAPPTRRAVPRQPGGGGTQPATGPDLSAPDPGGSRTAEPAPDPEAAGLPAPGPQPGAYLVRWANPALLELLGLDHTEVVGRTLADLPADGPTAWSTVIRRLLRGTSADTSAVVRRPDESRQPVTVDLCRLGQGTQGWLVTLHPATDAEQAARTALREAEHRFRALAEHAPTGIFLSDAGVRLGYLNARFAHLFGAEPHQLLGNRWLESIHPDDLPKVYDTLQWVLGGQAAEVTVRLRPDGGQRWVFLRVAPTTTPARAAGFVGTAEDVTSRRAWEERISYQAQHDPLTGLLHRGRLAELLREKLNSNRALDRELAVVLLDLDRFRDVNDMFGHEAGDRLLVEVATRLRRTARDQDTLARLSGDQFVVVLGGVRAAGQAEIAVRRHLEQFGPAFRLGGDEVRLTACAGVALPVHRDTPDGLLTSASTLLMRAKRTGPGSYQVGAEGLPDAGADGAGDAEGRPDAGADGAGGAS